MTPAPDDMMPMLLVAGDDSRDGLAAALPGFALETFDLDAADDPVTRARLAAARALLVSGDLLARAQARVVDAGLPDMPVLPTAQAATALPAALARRLAAAERDAGLARRGAALLRRETEEVSRRLQAVEQFMWGLGGPRLMQALTWSPSECVLPVRDGMELLRQRLPIDSPGIAAVDLWLPEADEDAARALGLALEDSDGTCHPLTLDEGVLRRDDGWLRFVTATPLQGDRQDCTLVLGGAPTGLALGLGPAVPDPDFALGRVVCGALAPAADEAATADRVLALRVWRAVAPSAMVVANGSAAARPEGGRASRIMPSELPRPGMLARPRSATDYVSTAFWSNEDALLVHPSIAGPVCAIVQRVPVARILRLSAVINAPRRDGPSLSFALGFAASDTITEDDWDDYLGPWVTLPPGGWGEVHAPLRSGALGGRLCDIIMATSVAGGGSNQNAWALFRAFRAVWTPTP